MSGGYAGLLEIMAKVATFNARIKTKTDCRKCEFCEIHGRLPKKQIEFSCLANETATEHCKSFKKGKPKEVVNA